MTKQIVVAKNNTPLMVTIDGETVTTETMDCEREAISRIVKITEDCTVTLGYRDDDKERTETKEAKAGDLLIIFYDSDFPHKFILVENDEWVENIDAYTKKMEMLKAAKTASDENSCCPCCDDCGC